MANYPYLNDKTFLRSMDEENYKEQFVKIIVLDFKTERPIANLTGKCTAGSCNVSGTSNMRRTASCTVAVDFDGIKVAGQSGLQQYNNITEVQNLISMNKKVRIETGFTNTLTWEYPNYANYNIIWFPLGTYVIKSASISKNNSGVNISLTLNDKTALLNGDMGGTIPAATVFSEAELFNSSGTSSSKDKLLIKDIIKYLVVEFGGENPDNVIVSGIDDYIKKVMKWKGSSNVYLVKQSGKVELTLNDPGTNREVYSYGMDVGYMNEPFVYPGTLECSAGETVASVLDKIKNTLGNFEWFYDLDGRFVFQEVKNYLLSTPTIDKITQATSGNYLASSNYGKSVYTFDKNNKNLISSISNNPQYQNIKNDFLVWGTTKTVTGADKPIRYHLAFDTKPTINTSGYRCIVYTDYKGLTQAIPLRQGETFDYSTAANGADMTNKKLYYLTIVNGVATGTKEFAVWHWDDDYNTFRRFSDHKVYILIANDWRAELYYLGLTASNKTFAKNYYSAELNAELPKFYNIIATTKPNTTVTACGETVTVPVREGAFRTDLQLSNYEYWLDFLEGDPSDSTSQSISQFNVNNIGRRTKVVTDGNSNCIFPASVPNYVYIEANGDTKEALKVAASKNQVAIQVSAEVYNNLVLGGGRNPAYDKIRELLYQHTAYNESVSLSVTPIYYLEPNTRITVHDNDTGVHGDYLITTISLPLTTNGTSNISATRCLERTF
jgi:hypothetical protein